MAAGTKVLHDPHKFIGVFRKGTGQLEELLPFRRQFHTAILANKKPDAKFLFKALDGA